MTMVIASARHAFASNLRHTYLKLPDAQRLLLLLAKEESCCGHLCAVTLLLHEAGVYLELTTATGFVLGPHCWDGWRRVRAEDFRDEYTDLHKLEYQLQSALAAAVEHFKVDRDGHEMWTRFSGDVNKLDKSKTRYKIERVALAPWHFCLSFCDLVKAASDTGLKLAFKRMAAVRKICPEDRV